MRPARDTGRVFGRGRKARDSARENVAKAVEQALDVLESRALFADRIEDWPAARAGVRATLDDPEQLELALFRLARKAGGPHSSLRRIVHAPGTPDLPTVERAQDAAIVRLPGCRAEHAGRYVAAARTALDGVEADRWIVDLRGTGNGTMWPVLAAVTPLLRGDGELGAFVRRDGTRDPWRLENGVLSLGGREQARGEAGRRPGSVAVLTDSETADSGEAVAVAFRGLPDVRSYGAPTIGFSSGNEVVPLPGGLTLNVTTSRFSDRTGRIHDGPLVPDVPGDDPLSLALWDL